MIKAWIGEEQVVWKGDLEGRHDVGSGSGGVGSVGKCETSVRGVRGWRKSEKSKGLL
jgi:hypothetical protein